MEEVGRAEIAIEYLTRKANIPIETYRNQILNHKEKVKAFQKLTHGKEYLDAFGDHFAQTLIDSKFMRSYVDYIFDTSEWVSYWDLGLPEFMKKQETGLMKAKDNFDRIDAESNISKVREVIKFLNKFLKE